MRGEPVDEWVAPWSTVVAAATAFRRSCALFAAAQLGVFAAIDRGAVTSGDVARRVGLDEGAARTLLDGLVAIGLLRAEAGAYAVDARLRPFLVDGPRSMAGDLRRFARENEVWLRAASILRGAEAPPADYSRELLDGRVADYPALLEFNRLSADAVVACAHEEVAAARRVLDLGGGDGSFSGAVLERNPSATVTVVEVEGGGAAPCLARHAAHVRSGRLRVVLGDARDFRPDEPFDLVIVNELLELFDAPDKERIVNSAVRSLAAGGSVVVAKFALDPTGAAPASSALFSLRMRLKGGTYLETDTDLIELLRRAGCTHARLMQSPPAKCVVIARREGPR